MIKYQLDIEKFVPTWEVYNSFMRDSLPVTTKFNTLPDVNSSSSD